MAEETITFELIRSIQREEQRGPKLTKLPEDFYKNVENYLQQKRNAENRKVVLETKNVERLIEDIFNRRERKILNQAIIAARTSIPPENLTEEEKEFFDALVKSIKERRKEVLNHILAEKKEELVTMIVFNEDTPAFMGADEKTYGPFKKGDIAKLPEENIRVLIEQGMAKEFTVSK